MSLEPLHNWQEFHIAEVQVHRSVKECEMTGREFTEEEYILAKRVLMWYDTFDMRVDSKLYRIPPPAYLSSVK